MNRPRKTAPGVKEGKVQKKNRWQLSPHYSINSAGEVEVSREKPGVGAKHYLRQVDVTNFTKIIPDWQVLRQGLYAIVLAEADESCYGWHSPGIVAVCAWQDGLISEWNTEFIEEHRAVLDRLDVEIIPDPIDTDWFQIRWTENSVMAFQLMNVLLHELGHHHDRMTTDSKNASARGEEFAETYALKKADQLWDRYYQVFPY